MGERNDLIERLRECDQPLINQPLPFSQVRQRIRDAASALETAATTIASLTAALAEAEKKGAEDWQPIETAPQKESLCGILFATKSHVGGVVQVWWSEPRRAFEDMEGDTYLDAFAWRPLPAPPRDLSQGDQHG